MVFAEQLAAMRRNAEPPRSVELTPDSVLRWGDKTNQPHFAAICRRLLLPGSRIRGLAHVKALVELARDRHPALLCLNHRSNLDVPTLLTLLDDQADPKSSELFHRIVWIAGRKLEEEPGMTGLLVQCFNRVIVTPPTWFAGRHGEDEVRQARLINIAAERTIARLRHEGWLCALFPAGTRTRPDRDSSKQAVEQTGSYVRAFQYMALCHIEGCTMPVSKETDLVRETPRLDRVTYTFGPVLRTEDWLHTAVRRFPQLDEKVAFALAMTADIEAAAKAPVNE